MLSANNTRLYQKNRLGQAREYQIVEGKELRMRIQDKFRNNVIAVSLLALGEKSSYHIHFAWGWLILAIIAGLAEAGLFIAKPWLNLQLGMYEFAIAIFIALLGVGALLIFVFKLSRERVFYARNSHIPLFDILVNNPSAQNYRQFLDALNENIKKARQFHNLNIEQQMAGELRMIRRLVGEGVLDQKLYDLAKERLFNANNRRAQPG